MEDWEALKKIAKMLGSLGITCNRASSNTLTAVSRIEGIASMHTVITVEQHMALRFKLVYTQLPKTLSREAAMGFFEKANARLKEHGYHWMRFALAQKSLEMVVVGIIGFDTDGNIYEAATQERLELFFKNVAIFWPFKQA